MDEEESVGVVGSVTSSLCALKDRLAPRAKAVRRIGRVASTARAPG